MARNLLTHLGMRRSRAALAAVLGGATLVVVAAAIVLARDDWNWARAWAERAVSRATGRELALAGDLRVDLGLVTEVEAHAVRFGNAAWAHAPQLLAADRVAFDLRLLPLLRGETRIERLELDGARVELEKDAAGRNNWTIPELGDGPTPIPSLVRLVDSRLRLLDPSRPQGFALRVDSFELADGGADRVARGRGIYQSRRFTIRARVGRPAAPDRPVPFVVRARVGRTDAWVRGVLGGRELGLQARLRIAGPSLDELWRLVGLPLPASPPYAARSRLGWRDDRVELADLRLRLGRSDLAGRLRVDLPPRGRMLVDADLRSREIDLDDIEGFYGRPPRRETASAAAPPPGAPSSIFPSLSFSFPKLRVADARIRFAARRVRGGTVLEDVSVRASLDRGRLVIESLRLGMAAGTLAARGVLDASTNDSRLAAELALSGLDLARLTNDLGLGGHAGGTLHGRATLVSRGDSLRAIASRADGEVGIGLERGWLSRELLELASLHLGGYIGQRLGKRRRPEPVNCLVGAFDAADGVLTSRRLLLDTDHARIDGRGTISLADESVRVFLRQHAKRLTVGALQTPVVIEGPLLASETGLEKRVLVARGGAAALLAAAVSPWATLLAIVDPGLADRPEVCADALAELARIATAVGDRASREPRSG